MPLIEGIGDEVTHFFIGLAVAVVVSLAWWTTSTSEQRHVQTVLLLDRRRHRAHRRLTNHTHSVTIVEGTSTVVNSTGETDVAVSTPQSASKPPEAGTSTARNPLERSRGAHNNDDEDDDDDEEDRNRIVETMDADTSVVRQRRLAFYDRNREDTSTGEDSSNDRDAPTMEHNYADVTSSGNSSQEQAPPPPPNPSSAPSADIKIRLKYINDDLKLVNGNLQEQLGDFKKRHFHGEISSNKLVRLIFNGQILHQDTKTLQGCGFFDNCVVHCLVHQRRAAPEGAPSDARGGESGDTTNRHRNTGGSNNNQGRDWDLGNFLFALVSFTLISAWYFRYMYAHLYNATATVGLVLLTGVFSIVLFGFYFPDQDHIPQRMDNAAAQS